MFRPALYCGWVCLLLASTGAAQNPKSVTFLRLSPQIVEQRLQAPAPHEAWPDVLRKQYAKALIPPDQIEEKAFAGSAQKMIVCTLKGRGDSVILVSASLEVPPREDKRNVAWASLAMLPLLAESLNSVSTEASIVLIAFPSDKHHNTLSRKYVETLNASERKKIKAAVEIHGTGRGTTSFDVKTQDHYLADWLVVAAASFRQAPPAKADYFDAEEFADAKAFRATGIPAITVSSTPQHSASAWDHPGRAVEALDSSAYYTTYQELSVFLVDIDRASRGESPRTSESVASAKPQTETKRSEFTDDQASTMVVRQIGEARDQYHTGTLSPRGIPELHDLVCDMAHKNQLDDGPFRSLLKQKQLSGVVAVFSGDYPNLTPEQLQVLKVARFHNLSVSSCAVSSPGRAPTYWIAALVY
jgi:hypothetical protein